MMINFRALVLAGLLALSLIAAPDAEAKKREANWVNDRLDNQSGRIAKDFAKKNHNEDKLIRADEANYRMEGEEQNMRGRHGGKLTRGDRVRLNRQLNRNNRRIRRGS